MSQIPESLQGNTAPLDGAQQMQFKIQQLQQMLLTSHPQMPVLLREIHTQLLKDEELVYLLKEEEISVIVNGLEKQSQVKIVAELASGKAGTAKKKSLSNITLDML